MNIGLYAQKITPEIERRIVELRIAGTLNTDTARMLNLCRSTVGRVLQKHGLRAPDRDRRKHYDPAVPARAVELKRKGRRIIDIADELKVSAVAVGRWLREAGLSRPTPAQPQNVPNINRLWDQYFAAQGEAAIELLREIREATQSSGPAASRQAQGVAQ